MACTNYSKMQLLFMYYLIIRMIITPPEIR
mgnify:CR=1 FL=1